MTRQNRTSPHQTTLLITLAALLLGVSACKRERDLTPNPVVMKAIEKTSLEHYAKRQTLNRMGESLTDRYPITTPIIASRDEIYFLGPDDAPMLLLIQRPLSLPSRVLVFEGPKKIREIPLKSTEKAIFSNRGQSIATYSGVDPEFGEPWFPNSDVHVYAPGSSEPYTIPRNNAVSIEALLNDGRLLFRDPEGAFRLYGPTGKLETQYSIPEFLESDSKRGPRSKINVLQAQNILVVRDFNGSRTKSGHPIQSGLRLFDLNNGALVQSFPLGMKATASSNRPERFILLERGGKLTRFDNQKPGPTVQMPGPGELALSPKGDYAAVTHTSNRLWLIDLEEMRVLWEHNSPAPWNRFINFGTQVANGGRVYASRLHLDGNSQVRNLQMFTIDSTGSGLVLLERPYKDALIPPVAMMGTTDSGMIAMFGALGEEIRVLDLTTAGISANTTEEEPNQEKGEKVEKK